MEDEMLPGDQRTVELGRSTGAPLRCVRILNGLWQVSGAHGAIDPRAAVPAMQTYHDAGFTTWDLADHYGPAEDFIGAFRRELSARGGASEMLAFTKLVPNPGPMTRPVVEAAVGVSLRRMKTDRLDLLQFHWWEYGDSRYLDAMAQLAMLRDEGRIRHLGLTNFDTSHMERILNSGVGFVSNQVQYSLVDRRPEVRMVDFCQAHEVGLLTYGTLCGGLLTDRFLDRPEPSRAELNTASLQKYKQMIDLWGGWELFQRLLRTLRAIADKHGVSIANVAVRAILDNPAVAGVIVGARLGVSEHIAENARVFALRLDDEDRARIDAVLGDGRNLYRIIGDCGDEYRRQ
jgi:aryl-alcohol dehydrogenase-like predicted oxidoreductase